MSVCFYHFKACKPEDVVYQLDYHYFRKPAAEMDGDEEIFCDDVSRLNMLQRVFKGRILWLLIIFFITVIPNMIINFTDFVSGKPARAGILVMWIVLFVMYAVLLIRFALKYYAFKKKVVR